MKTFLKHVMISAVVFKYLFLVAATPIPKPFTASDLDSRVLPADLVDDKVPTITVTLPNVDIRVNDEPALLSRGTSAEITETRPLVTVPKEFLQVSPESAPVTMRVPRVTDYTSLRSVIRILHLMNAAVNRCDALKGPRDTFEDQLQKIPYLKSIGELTYTINLYRFPESEEENLQVLDLETLKHHITDAGGEAAKLLSHWRQMRYRLKTGFKLDLKPDTQKVRNLRQGEREAFERQFIRVVDLHNNANWIYRDIQESRSATILIPPIFVSANSDRRNPPPRTLSIPSNNDKNGVDSLNNILQLMAKVAGPETIRTNIGYVYEQLTKVIQPENIEFPDKWGTDAMTNEERAHQQSLVVTEIRKHNEAVEESYKNVFKGIGHRKRKADGSPEQDGTLQKQKGGESGNKSAGERLSHSNQVGPGTGTTGSHLELLMPPMDPGTNDRSLPAIRTAFHEQFDGSRPVHPQQLKGTHHRPTLPGVLRVPPNNQRGDSETSSQRGPS
ncbi:hypothetical protein H0H93_008793 [Arthromyces matolae]|nr:hypothetical protein H0H93_008793 [Arthromyces matolae]